MISMKTYKLSELYELSSGISTTTQTLCLLSNHQYSSSKKHTYKLSSSNEDCSSYHVAILLYELLEEIEKLVDNKVNLEINKLSELDPLIKNISTINSNEYEFLYNQIKNNIANNYLNNNLIDDKSFDLCIQFMNDIFNYYISGYPDIPDEFLFNKNDNN